MNMIKLLKQYRFLVFFGMYLWIYKVINMKSILIHVNACITINTMQI